MEEEKRLRSIGCCKVEVFIIEIKMRRRMILTKTKTSFTNLTPSQEIEQPCRWTEEWGRTR